MGVPTWMYRRDRKSGEIVSQIFDNEELPKGWVDTPAKLDSADKPGGPGDDPEA